MCVADNPYRTGKSRDPAVEHRIICKDCADTDHDRAELMPEFLYVSPGFFSRDPLGKTRIGCDLSIDRHGIFHHYIRPAGLNVMEEDLVDSVTFLLENTFYDLDAMFPQDPYAASGNPGIWISASDNDPADTRFQDRVCTGRLPAVMAAGFQCDIHSSSGRRLHTVFKGIALSMQFTVPLMISLSYNRPVIPDDHCADHRIGRHPSAAF